MRDKLLTALLFFGVILVAFGCPYWVELILG